MKPLFAHATGVPHEETVATAILSNWVAVPLFLLLLLLVFAALTKLKVSFGTIVLIMQFVLLVLGILAFQFQPVVGGLAIALGFGITLITVMVGLKGGGDDGA